MSCCDCSLGSGLLFIERRQFLQDLYDTLPDKYYIKTNSGVEDVIEDENGVEVRLSNGEVERGDLVLGCDGVYSPVRTIMWDHANRATPGLITTQEKMGTSQYIFDLKRLKTEPFLY